MGLDVHQSSITAAILHGDSHDPEVVRMTSNLNAVRRLFRRLSKHGVTRSCDGYLRQVTQIVSQSQSQIVLNTTVGSLVDGIERCDIEETYSLPIELEDVDDFLPEGVEVHGDSLVMQGFTVFDDEVTVPDGQGGWVTVSLFVGFDRVYVVLASPTLDFDLHILDTDLEEYRTLFQSETAFGCDFTVNFAAAYTPDIPDMELYRKTIKKKTWVWFVPVYHYITTTVTLKTYLNMVGGVDASVDGLGVEQSVDIGARYQNPDWGNLNAMELSIMEPEIDALAYAALTLKPSIEFKIEDKLYNVVGLAGWMEPYVRAVGRAECEIVPPPDYWDCEFCLEVNAGCDVGCGVAGLDAFGLPDDFLQFDVPLVDVEIYPSHSWPWDDIVPWWLP